MTSVMEKWLVAAEVCADQISFAKPREWNGGSHRPAQEGNCLLEVCNYLRPPLSLPKDRETGHRMSRRMNYFQTSESDW